MSVKKVLVIPAWFDHENEASGIFISEFCEAINEKEEIDITLLYIQFFSIKNIFSYYFNKRPIFNYSYKVEHIRILNLKSKLLFFLSHEFILKHYSNKILKKIKKSGIAFDLIHAQSLCNNVTPYIIDNLSKRFDIPYILTEHYTSFKESNGLVFDPFLTKQFVCEVAQNAKKRIAVSDFAAIMFEDYFKVNFETIYNVISKKFFINGEFCSKNLDFTFLSIAPLTERKGVLELLKSFKSIHEIHQNIRLVIIGEGPLYSTMNNYILNNNLNSSVTLKKWKNKTELIRELDKSHVLVSASERETFGLTIAEALLRGIPIISTKSGGPQELVNESNGILIELNQKVKRLEEALLKMILNYDNFNSENIKEDALKKFHSDEICNSYVRIYDEIVA